MWKDLPLFLDKIIGKDLGNVFSLFLVDFNQNIANQWQSTQSSHPNNNTIVDFLNNLHSQYFQELMWSKTMKYNYHRSMLPITFLCPSINPLMKAKLGIHNQVATHEKVFTYNGQLMGSSIVPFPYEKWIIPTCSSSCTFISQNFPRLPTYLPTFVFPFTRRKY